ncbi:Fas apoptotic inhibitory molecule 2 [Salmo salar]|uniref:Protein lifeguard 2 n=1 Tax=Salmo salar TaxID=8030 RepID=B5XE11_SALSA|nr:Fas apoptotic inhibitory molecule 2 [Salmo salar]ACI69081.1 Fas apoptotic inhibitory molecule 2 [Salmo salar]|eukprot:NP_001134832.1 Fas apoptotic inhibitory molecule 2 [Salmo salar]
MTKGKQKEVELKEVELDEVSPKTGKEYPPSYEEATADYEEMQTQFSWDDQAVRRIFIRKVYAILMIQLFVTVAIVALFTFCAPVRFYIQAHPHLYMCSYMMFLATYIALNCCGEQIRRQFPWNLILLSLFTLSLACMMGFVSSFYNTKSVVLCLGITAVVCMSVTIFSFQTKIDFTSYQGVLFVLTMVMLRLLHHTLHRHPFWICSLVTSHLRCDRSYPLHSVPGV